MKLFSVGLLAILAAAINAAPQTASSKKEDYVIDFDVDHVKKENMDAVMQWLKKKGIDAKDDAMETYAAYIVAELDQDLADELLSVGKQQGWNIDNVQPDLLDWSDLDKEEL